MAKILIKIRKKLWLPFKYAILREKRKLKWGHRTIDEIEQRLIHEIEQFFKEEREAQKSKNRDEIIKQEAKIVLLKWLLKREDVEINNI